ncbi:MAG TPA: hypothetical protein VKH61_03165 [Streptosporangiaceae bacterium]|nr:hypothetical protein [Streptosporangiaceae bacterium]
MSAPWAMAIRLSFAVVSPENTTEPSAVSNRYASAGTARPCMTATALTRTASSSKTITGTGPGGTSRSKPRTSDPASGMRASSGMTFRW